MRPTACFLAVMCLSGSGLLHAQSCAGLTNFQKSIGASPGGSANAPDSQIDCGSLTSVWNKVAARNKSGGRKLEGDKPFDPAAAQADLDAALRSPTVRSRFGQVAHEAQDPMMRMFLEAAILDEEGYYNARELRIQELQKYMK